MGYENKAGLNVNNHYGVRKTGGAVGLEHGEGSTFVLRIDLTGQSIADAVAGFMPPVVIPKYARFTKRSLQVDEVFVVTGTTPTLLIGAAGSVATNGFIITEAELEALGNKILTNDGEGTWDIASATGTTAAAKVAMALEGDTAIATTQGKATLTLEYTCVAK